MAAKDDQSHRTAIARSGPSAPAKAAFKAGLFTGAKSVLDFGCGRGADVDYYSKVLPYEVKVLGYDPHYKPDDRVLGLLSRKSELTSRAINLLGVGYDVVTCQYVVNVLEDDEAAAVAHSIRQLTNRRGIAIVSARSTREVDASARAGRWKPAGHGWITGSGTYQRGYTWESLSALMGGAGFSRATKLAVGGGSVCAVCR